jgi:hypothetical protein
MRKAAGCFAPGHPVHRESDAAMCLFRRGAALF